MDAAKELALLDWIDNELFGTPTGIDIAKHAPELTLDDAYRLRVKLLARRVAKGDVHVGYKIAGGGSGIQVAGAEAASPTVGPLMRSGLVYPPDTYSFAGSPKVIVEAEIAVMLKKDLMGPGLTQREVLAAVEGYFPAIEIVPQSGGPRASAQARALATKFSGGIVLGTPLCSPHGIDLAMEAAMMSVNGEPKAAGTGINIMGNPLNAVAEVANMMSKYGEGLKAGMVIMTGTVTGLTPVKPGDYVEASFTRLGRATARFVG